MVPMKEQLQQIQAVAIVTFLCVLISVHSDGDYGKWFVIDGVRVDITHTDAINDNGTVDDTTDDTVFQSKLNLMITNSNTVITWTVMNIITVRIIPSAVPHMLVLIVRTVQIRMRPPER